MSAAIFKIPPLAGEMVAKRPEGEVIPRRQSSPSVACGDTSPAGGRICS
jgi:hypothetical protein